MGRLEYPTGRAGERPVVVQWVGWWTKGVISQGDSEVGTLADEKAFLRGGTFTLPDGRAFSFRLVRGWSGQRYDARIDGQDVTGDKGGDPLEAGGYALCIFGGLTIAGSLFQMSSSPIWHVAIGTAVGLALIALGMLAMKRKRWPLLAGASWFALNSVGTVVLGVVRGGVAWSTYLAVALSALIAFLLARWYRKARSG